MSKKLTDTILNSAPKVGSILAPRVIDPTATSLMVNVLDPDGGGIWCVDGKLTLPVGGVIWSRDPEKDAGWVVKFRENPNSEEIIVPHENWQPLGFDTSKPGVTRGNITATVYGVDYQCYRTLTVTATEEEAGNPPVITDTTIPNGFVGMYFEHTFSVSSGSTTPILWSALGALPDGLTLDTNTGTLSGTPTAEGTTDITIRAMNAYGTNKRTLSFHSLGPNELDITPIKTQYYIGEEIQPADLIVKYNGNVIPMDQLTGYSITYNPTEAGPQMARVAYDPHLEEISDLARGKYQVEFVDAEPTITTTSLPDGNTTSRYNVTLQATGSRPITWWAAASVLPSGLTLDANTGVLSGIPTAHGSFEIGFKASNAKGDKTKTLYLTIEETRGPHITTSSLPATQPGVPYSFQFEASGPQPITWSALTTLPTGLTLSTSGLLSGTTSSAGRNIQVQASNAFGNDEGLFYLE